MKEKLYGATADILLKNMQILDPDFIWKPVICVYDTHSELSKLLAEGYENTLKNIENAEMINFDSLPKDELKEKLMSLEEGATVILVQSTNFRLDDFRIRLNLNNQWVGCLEHNHLGYLPTEHTENYIDSIVYNSDYYEELSDKMHKVFSTWDKLEMKTVSGDILTVEWGFEEMKRNTWDYRNKKRGGTFPIGENFTEAKDFSRVNGSFTVFAYPDERFQVQFSDEPFRVDVKNSLLTCNDPKCPQVFRALLDQIAESEDGEVHIRELGFGMNTGISKEKRLSNIWAYERVTGFHLSLWKKHNIYRKKFDKKITQRYHIDIFPDVDTISVDGKMIFQDGKYVI